MALLELHPLIDMKALAALYSDPYISRVGHDDRPAEPLNHPAVQYVGAYVDGDLVGAFMAIESGFIELDVHALLSRSAIQYSREFGSMFLNQMFADPKIERVTAYVIDGLTAAMNYCIKLGFKYEGKRRNACRQYGKVVDVHILGMTRNDWKESQ